MPPKKGKPLTEAEKDLLKRWIDQGAEYKPHWAFVKVERPALPVVKNKAWIKNEIDAFILARLEKAASSQPSRPRDAHPPAVARSARLAAELAEVDQFLADRSASANERLVDRMWRRRTTAKMAVLWLDLARFGDTSGYHMDSTRQMSLCRDWVINAFNQDMPFDQFTIEQLAGDLLPNATQDQKIAVGLQSQHRFNEEGGVDPEEYVIRYNVDRTNTLGQVWLGLTLGCAECHTHKYDPIRTRNITSSSRISPASPSRWRRPSVYGKLLEPILKECRRRREQRVGGNSRRFPCAKKASPRSWPIPVHRKRAEIASRMGIGPKEATSFRNKSRRPSISSRPNAAILRKNSYEIITLAKSTRKYSREPGRSNRSRRSHAENQGHRGRSPYTLVSEEMPNPRPAYVLFRGDFPQRREGRAGRSRRCVPPLPEGRTEQSARSGPLAGSPDHPLTARVTVNRLWAKCSATASSAPSAISAPKATIPSHPGIARFWRKLRAIRSPGTGWDDQETARRHRSIRDVSAIGRLFHVGLGRQARSGRSAVARVAAYIGSDAEELWHSPSLNRRDLIANRRCRRSCRTSRPDFYKNKNEEWPWTPSAGNEQYRRGLYAFWRRTALHPMFAILDAAEPRRMHRDSARRTNTPLQASVTLNDPASWRPPASSRRRCRPRVAAGTGWPHRGSRFAG